MFEPLGLLGTDVQLPIFSSYRFLPSLSGFSLDYPLTIAVYILRLYSRAATAAVYVYPSKVDVCVLFSIFGVCVGRD